MKNKLLSILLMLAVAFSLAIGTAVMSNAAGETMSLKLTDGITAKIDFTTTVTSATYQFANSDGSYDGAEVYNAHVESNSAYIQLAVKDIGKTFKVTPNAGDPVETSAEAYLNKISDEYKDLAAALVAYGDVAAKYFADAEVTAPAAAPEFPASTFERSDKIDGINHYKATLLLETVTTIRHYFKLEGEAKIEDYTIFVDRDLDGGVDNNEIITPEAKGASYYVDITGITPNDLDRAYTLFVKNNGTGATYYCTYSALDWASRTYKKEAATNADKALSDALNTYNAEAAKLGGNIIYCDENGEELNRVRYEEGIVNYVNYSPNLPAYTGFSGWVDENGNKVTSIPATQNGDVKLYPAFDLGEALVDGGVKENFTYKDLNSSLVSTANNKWFGQMGLAVDKYGISAIVAKDEYTTYSYDSYQTAYSAGAYAPYGTANFDYPILQIYSHNNYGTREPSFFDKVSGYSSNTVKYTVELGSIADAYTVPVKFALSAKQTYSGEKTLFTVGSDGYVYFGDSTDASYRIAQLTTDEEKLTKVSVYLTFSNYRGTSYPRYYYADAKVHAIALNGEILEASFSSILGGSQDPITQMIWGLKDEALEGKAAAIRVGDISVAPTKGAASYASLVTGDLSDPTQLPNKGITDLNTMMAFGNDYIKLNIDGDDGNTPQYGLTSIDKSNPDYWTYKYDNSYIGANNRVLSIYSDLGYNGKEPSILSQVNSSTSKTMKFTLQLGAVDGYATVPISMQFRGQSLSSGEWPMHTLFTVGSDGYVYFNGKTYDSDYRIAKLSTDPNELTDVTVFIRFNNITEGAASNEATDLVFSAVTLSGELKTMEADNYKGGHGYEAFRMRWGIKDPTGLEAEDNDDKSAALRVGDIDVSIDDANMVVDGNNANAFVMRYTAFNAARLPEAPTREGYTFGGWYTDAACTDGNEINSIEAGNAGTVTVYGKWTANSAG